MPGSAASHNTVFDRFLKPECRHLTAYGSTDHSASRITALPVVCDKTSVLVPLLVLVFSRLFVPLLFLFRHKHFLD